MKRCTSLRTNLILSDLCDHIDKFLPVFRDVAKYWSIFLRRDPHDAQIVAAINHLIKDSDYRSTLFLEWWILDLLYRYKILSEKLSFRYCDECADFLKDRYHPLLSMTYNRWDLIREYKEKWQNYSRATQRSIIKASSILTKDERQHWLNSLRITNDFLTWRLAIQVQGLP